MGPHSTFTAAHAQTYLIMQMLYRAHYNRSSSSSSSSCPESPHYGHLFTLLPHSPIINYNKYQTDRCSLEESVVELLLWVIDRRTCNCDSSRFGGGVWAPKLCVGVVGGGRWLLFYTTTDHDALHVVHCPYRSLGGRFNDARIIAQIDFVLIGRLIAAAAE